MKKNSIQNIDPYEARFQRLFSHMDRLNQQMGDIGESQGEDAEEFFANSLGEDKTIGGIRFDAVYTQVKGGEPGNQQAYDLILESRSAAAVIEVKYKFRKRDLAQLEQQLQRIQTDFPKYKRKRLYGGIAGFSIPTEVARAAHEKGYFVLRRRGQLMRVDVCEMKEARV